MRAPGTEELPDRREAEATILGQPQEAWLNQGLRNDAVWNLIAQQVFIMPLKGVNARGQALPAFNDKWDGYPASRRRLVQTISDLKLTNVVFSGGDAHMHAVGYVPLRDDEPTAPRSGPSSCAPPSPPTATALFARRMSPASWMRTTHTSRSAMICVATRPMTSRLGSGAPTSW